MFRVDQQDTEGKWWLGGAHYATHEQATYAKQWLDCPGRVVKADMPSDWRNELNDEEKDWLKDDMAANDADYDTYKEEEDDE